MSHGAMPLTGVNTAYPMAHFLTLVQTLQEREIVRHGCDDYLGQPSITPTILRSPCHGEPQKNVMPEATEVLLDLRLLPAQDPDAIVRQLESMLQAVTAADPQLDHMLEVIELRHPTETDRKTPVVKALAAAYTDLTGAEPVYGGVPGSTDGTILWARKGIPIVTCGPGDIHIPHHVDEWVDIEEIKLAARMYALTAIRYLGADDES
jgi:succinyl-diaminopimelate desuccinylase